MANFEYGKNILGIWRENDIVVSQIACGKIVVVGHGSGQQVMPTSTTITKDTVTESPPIQKIAAAIQAVVTAVPALADIEKQVETKGGSSIEVESAAGGGVDAADVEAESAGWSDDWGEEA